MTENEGLRRISWNMKFKMVDLGLIRLPEETLLQPGFKKSNWLLQSSSFVVVVPVSDLFLLHWRPLNIETHHTKRFMLSLPSSIVLLFCFVCRFWWTALKTTTWASTDVSMSSVGCRITCNLGVWTESVHLVSSSSFYSYKSHKDTNRFSISSTCILQTAEFNKKYKIVLNIGLIGCFDARRWKCLSTTINSKWRFLVTSYI